MPTTKKEMVAELTAKGIAADETMHPATLKSMLKQANEGPKPGPGPAVSNLSSTPPMSTPKAGDRMIAMSEVQAMIAEALAHQQQTASGPVKVKKVTEHHAHAWRFDGKWVVDFVDRNIDPTTGEKVDSYIKEKIHAYQKFNEQRREFEPWIEIKFQDGTTKNMPLNNYVKNRVLVYCTIIKRHELDKSYSIGEVEKKKEEGDKLVGTGILVDQDVNMVEETFEVKTPNGETLMLPWYVVA